MEDKDSEKWKTHQRSQRTPASARPLTRSRAHYLRVSRRLRTAVAPEVLLEPEAEGLEAARAGYLHTVSDDASRRLPNMVVRELHVPQREVGSGAAKEAGRDRRQDIRSRASAFQILQQPRKLLLQAIGGDGEGAVPAETMTGSGAATRSTAGPHTNSKTYNLHWVISVLTPEQHTPRRPLTPSCY